MIKSVLEPGNKITLQMVRRGNAFSQKPVEKNTYTSELLSLENPKELKVSTPIFRSHLLEMTAGDIYFLRIYTQNGLYQCKCAVKSIGKEGKIAFTLFQLVTNLERHQRREYFRLECRIPIEHVKVNEFQQDLYAQLQNAITEGRKRIIKEQIRVEELDFAKGLMLDISGGGMRFNSKEQYEKDDALILVPSINEITEDIPFFMGKVVMSRGIGDINKVYENKIKFFNISSQEREKIITYIFAAERSKMKND